MGNTVFISWSGERSRYVAEALRGWLPVVLQAVEPWMSAADMEKGTRWENEISAQLDEADVGIICLTPENLGSPWLLFEAGALSKKLTKSRVCTYLLDLTAAEVPPPMGMFQHTIIAKDHTRQLLDSINNAQAQPIRKEVLDTSFGALWPSLEEKFKAIPPQRGTTKQVRKVEDMVAELLEITRGLPEAVAARVGGITLNLTSSGAGTSGVYTGSSGAGTSGNRGYSGPAGYPGGGPPSNRSFPPVSNSGGDSSFE